MKIKEFFFTAFYSGYSPVAPGTAGTLVAMALYILENFIFSSANPLYLNIFNFLFVLVIIYPCIKLGDSAEIFYNTKDPQQVVLDEVLGYWIGILFIPFSFSYALMAFFLFRLFDIIKPYPANTLQSLKGGLGIMIDDIIAGIYTLACMNTAVYFFNRYNIILP
jgi:phosphatidylglycerophosphatase A